MKKLTINEIAERAGVSKTTVSFFLNGKTNKMSEETKQRLQRIIDETGYEPNAAARAMKAKSTGIIGVILEDVSDPYCAKALKGMEEAAGAQEYQIVVGSSGLNFNVEKDYVDRMLKAGAEGFIIQSTYRFGMMANALEKKNKPIIYLDTKPYDFKGRYVKSNNYDCVYKVVAECVKKGYEDFIMFAQDASAMSTGFENTQGYKDALQDAGIEGHSYYVPEAAKSADIYEIIRQAVDWNRRTMIYAAGAQMLKMVYQAVRSYPDHASLFPETLGLIGYDAEGWTRFTTPPISAIIIPAYEEGIKACETLIELVEGKKAEGEIVFKNVVKWRGTTL